MAQRTFDDRTSELEQILEIVEKEEISATEKYLYIARAEFLKGELEKDLQKEKNSIEEMAKTFGIDISELGLLDTSSNDSDNEESSNISLSDEDDENE